MSAVASYDTTNNCYEFDWDAVLGDANAVWMLELATYDAVGLTNIDVRIPDQEAYLAAIGEDTKTDDKPAEDLEEDTTNTNGNKNEIDYGEGTNQDSDDIDETPSETDKPNDSAQDTDLRDLITDIIAELGVTGNTDKPDTDTDTTIDVNVKDDTNAGTSTDVVANPATGDVGLAGFTVLGALGATLCGVFAAKRK